MYYALMDDILQYILSSPLESIIEKIDFYGNKFSLEFEACSIVNARSGLCGGDCKYCAQSGNSSAEIDIYPLLSDEQIIKKAVYNKLCGASRFSIVTSGQSLSEPELERICRLIPKLKEKTGMEICASLGFLDKNQLRMLKSAGLSRYHHNIETSPGYYPKIVSTHKFEERVKTVLSAKDAGLEVCCGGIIGMGETWQDRLDMALLLKQISPNAVPLNMFVPIKGTPLGGLKMILREEALRSIALFRILLGGTDIKIIAGREILFSEDPALPFKFGANGAMVGGYLTIKGEGVESDLQFVKTISAMFSNSVPKDVLDNKQL